MQIFGLVSLLVTILLATFWLSGSFESVQLEGEDKTSYQESIEAANEAADLIENR